MGMLRSIVKKAVFGALIGAGSVWVGRKLGVDTGREPGEGAAVRKGEGTIRSAGPDAMRTRPRRKWTAVDQAGDESFPASDSPAV